MSEKFLKEAIEIERVWKKSGLLDKIVLKPGEVFLDGQRLLPSADICMHPNAYIYGDTNPPTYKCPDCGLTFIRG